MITNQYSWSLGSFAALLAGLNPNKSRNRFGIDFAISIPISTHGQPGRPGTSSDPNSFSNQPHVGGHVPSCPKLALLFAPIFSSIFILRFPKSPAISHISPNFVCPHFAESHSTLSSLFLFFVPPCLCVRFKTLRHFAYFVRFPQSTFRI